MSCGNNHKDELRIVKGNAFHLRVQVTARRMDGTIIEDFDLGEASPVLTVLYGGTGTETGMVVEGNEAVVYFNGNQGLGWYGLEMAGTWEGEAWRWCVEKVFQVVNTNAKANVPEWAFFTDDSYTIAGTFDLVAAPAAAVQSDWTETDPNSAAFILHKPDLSVYALKSEVSDVVRYSSQTLTDAQKRQARTNIGAQERGNFVENLAGAASAYTTLIKAGNDGENQSSVRVRERGVKLEAEAGSVEVSQNGVAVTAGNSGFPDAKMTLNGKEVATKDDVSAVSAQVAAVSEVANAAAPQATTYTKQEVDDAIEAIDVSAQIAGKADKVTGAVSGDFAGLDANGNLVDSGKKASDFATAAQGAKADAAAPQATTYTKGEVDSALAGKAGKATTLAGYGITDAYTKQEVDDAIEAIDVSAQIAGKADKVAGAVTGDFAGLDVNGNLVDSGKKASDFATAAQGAKADAAAPQATTYTKTEVDSALAGKQATLVSAVNIKTINGNSLLGAGDLSIGGGGGSDDAVLYTEQTLTDGQKAQARTNIGAQTSMTIGTTTTVQPGVDASVVNSGTAQAPVLDFFIPKGEKGDTGSVVVTDGVAQIAIVNDLTTGGTGDALSAEQGKVLETELTGLKQTLKPIIGGTDAMGEAVKSTSKKYVTSAGSISNSSTATMVVAFYEIPDNISRIDISIPKTGNSSTRPVSFADDTSQTSGLSVYSGGGNAGAQTYSVLDWGEHPYLVLNFNSAEGNPTITVETDPTDVTKWVTRDEIAGYTKEDDLTGAETPQNFDQTLCTIGGTYIKKTDGSEYQYSGFQCSDFLRILGNELVVTSNYTLTNAALVAFYTMDKTFISAIDGTTAYTAESFAVPANAAYMRLTKKSSTRLTIATTATGAKAVLAAVLDIQGGEPVKTLNVLWIGNSFTMNSLTYITDLLTNTGVSGVTIHTVTRGGTGFQWYSANFSSATHTVNTVVGESISLTATLENILKATAYDVVLIQQVSADADSYATYVPYLADFVNQIKVASLNPFVKIGLAAVWGTYESTFAGIVAATQQAEANHQGLDYLVPLGTAIESARISPIAEGNNDFSSDANIWHLAEGFGRYVAGCVFYECVIAPWSGVHVAADVTTTVAVSGNLGEVAVTAENRGEAQAFAMRAAVLKYTPVAIS